MKATTRAGRRLGAAGKLVLIAAALAAPRGHADCLVDSVIAGDLAERAGLRGGDRLVAWSTRGCPRAGARRQAGAVGSPFDVVELEREEAPRCVVTLDVRRGDELLVVELGDGNWGLRPRPDFHTAQLESHERARKLAAGGQLDEALDTLARAGGRAAPPGARAGPGVDADARGGHGGARSAGRWPSRLSKRRARSRARRRTRASRWTSLGWRPGCATSRTSSSAPRPATARHCGSSCAAVPRACAPPASCAPWRSSCTSAATSRAPRRRKRGRSRSSRGSRRGAWASSAA